MSDIRVNIFVGDERLDDAIFALLSRLDVRESDRQRSVARLRFALVQGSSGEFSPVDDDVFEPAVRLRVELTAPAAEPVHLFDGYVSHLRPHFESILSNCYLEVIATDAALLSTPSNTWRVTRTCPTARWSRRSSGATRYR